MMFMIDSASGLRPPRLLSVFPPTVAQQQAMFKMIRIGQFVQRNERE